MELPVVSVRGDQFNDQEQPNGVFEPLNYHVPDNGETVDRSRRDHRAKCKQQLAEVLQNSSINGVSQAFSKSKLHYKAFWFGVFAAGVIAFVVNLSFNTIRFAKWPILTQMERERKRFEWPHFTFCPTLNPIPFWASEVSITKWNETMQKAELYDLPLYNPERNNKIWEQYMSIATINPDEYFHNLVKHSIFKVEVSSEDPAIAAYASAADSYRPVMDFEELFDVRMDTIRSLTPCFTLHPEKLREHVKLLRRGHQLISIKIYLIMDAQSYMTYNLGYESRKLHFYILEHNASILGRSPFYILPGTDSSFRMHEKIHKRISDCTKETFTVELYNISMTGTRQFNGGFEDCRTYISQETFVKNCDCYNPYLPIYKFSNMTPVICTNMTLFNNTAMSKNIRCLNRVLSSNFNSVPFIAGVEERCRVFRLDPCVETSYFTSRYTTIWQNLRNPSRRKMMQSNYQRIPNYKPNISLDEFWKSNLAIVRLDWGKKNTEVTFEEYEYPTSQYISDFGGIIGLWLGLGVISFFELLEIIYVSVKYHRIS